MMSIGEFAELTGLSVKALRLYDEQGLLKPARVDPDSRHRRYSAAQFEPAIRLKAMRAADLPLAEAPALLDGGPDAETLLAGHGARLAAERERQDAALEALGHLLGKADRHEWQVLERTARGTGWAGVVLPVPDVEDPDVEAADDLANEAFAELWRALDEDGNRPTGAFWTTMRGAAGSDTVVEILCCWPVARAVPEGWRVPGRVVESGTLEEGRELVVRWRFDDPVVVVDGATHPAVLALLAAAEERGEAVDLSRLRQIGLMEQGGVAGMEVAIALNGPGA